MSVDFSSPSDTSFASDETPVPDPDDVFEELVADPSRCCQHCFRRLRSRRRFPDLPGHEYADILSFVKTEYPDEGFDVLDRVYWEAVRRAEATTNANPPTDTPTQTHSACRFCGAVDPAYDPTGTRSRDEAIFSALGISATLAEHGIPHNPLVLVVEASELKREPETAGDDFETFRLATSRSIRAVGGRQ